MKKWQKISVAVAGGMLVVGTAWGGVALIDSDPSPAAAVIGDKPIETSQPPEDCKALQGTFAVPAQHCTSEDVNPRPLDEISPNGDAGACWPARQFDSPVKASNWLAANAAGKLRAAQFSTFASKHREYNGYTGTTGDDYAEYTGTLIREQLTKPIRILNHYCDADGVKRWKVQVLPVGKVVYFRPGYSPSQTTPDKIKPVKLEACGNDVLPPPPPPPPACPPGSDMAGQPIPPDGDCNNPPSTTPPTTTRPPGSTPPTSTTPPRTTEPGKIPGKGAQEENEGHNGKAPKQEDPVGPPAAGRPPSSYTPAPQPTRTTTPRPTSTVTPPPVAPGTTHTSVPPPPSDDW